jgi:hypothetical protein
MASYNGASTSEAFHAGGRTAAVSGVFYGIGQTFNASTGFYETGGVGHIATHAVVGGIISVAQGGKFGHGFFSAGFTKYAGGFIPQGGGLGGIAVGTIASAVIGGTASVISGGKFANGAYTGAFQFLFNEALSKQIVKNPVTDEYEEMMGGMQPYRDSEGNLLLSSDLSIVQITNEGKLAMLMYGDRAVVLQCQAMEACTGGYVVNAPNNNMNKPRMSGNASVIDIKVVGNGWYMISSAKVGGGLEILSHYNHVIQCGNNASVIASCGGG